VSTAKCPAWDNTLLTVGFNLRIGDAACHISTKSRRDGTLSIHCVVLAGLCGVRTSFNFRRLKSTVNKVSSLRDFALNKLYLHFIVDTTLFWKPWIVAIIESTKVDNYQLNRTNYSIFYQYNRFYVPLSVFACAHLMR